jgi:chromosome condensin MukBEF ATPase and DNA-binding subunit MukB
MTFHDYVRVVPETENRNSSGEDDMLPSYDRDLGNHDARLEALERDIAAMRHDVREVRDLMVTAKGGWKAIALIAGISSVVGGFLVKIAPWLLAGR